MAPLLQLLRRRSYSTGLTPDKTTSPHVGFYKTFRRPLTKVFFSAIVAYQLVYLLWVKLETEEMKIEKKEEIKRLEAQLQAIKDSR